MNLQTIMRQRTNVPVSKQMKLRAFLLREFTNKSSPWKKWTLPPRLQYSMRQCTIVWQLSWTELGGRLHCNQSATTCTLTVNKLLELCRIYWHRPWRDNTKISVFLHFQILETWANLPLPLNAQKLEVFQLSSLTPFTPEQGLFPWSPLGLRLPTPL